MAEFALATALICAGLVGAVFFLTKSTESRESAARALYTTYDIPSPR